MHTSNPSVVGLAFAELNPPMSARAGMPEAQPGEGLHGPHFSSGVEDLFVDMKADETRAMRPHKASTATVGTDADRVPFAVGDSIMFLYPVHPFFGVRSMLAPHFVRIDRIVDLFSDPLERKEVHRQPLLMRDRFTIHATEISTGAPCEFGWDAMQEVRGVPKSLAKSKNWAKRK